MVYHGIKHLVWGEGKLFAFRAVEHTEKYLMLIITFLKRVRENEGKKPTVHNGVVTSVTVNYEYEIVGH